MWSGLAVIVSRDVAPGWVEVPAAVSEDLIASKAPCSQCKSLKGLHSVVPPLDAPLAQPALSLGVGMPALRQTAPFLNFVASVWQSARPSQSRLPPPLPLP